MKRYLAILGNVFILLFGMIGLKTPGITDLFNLIGIGFIAESPLLQPLFIGFVIIAIWGQFYKVKQTLAIWPIIAELVLGVLAYLFVFPLQNHIVGYTMLALILLLMILPLLSKFINKKKIVKIKV